MTDYSARRCEGPNDLAAIIDFARSNMVARQPGPTRWHPGDIAWQLAPADSRGTAAFVRIWSDGQGTAAVAIFEPPLIVNFDTRADISDVRPLVSDILEWAEERRRRLLTRAERGTPIAYAMLGQSTLATEVPDSQAGLVEVVGALGYERAERGSIHCRRDLAHATPATVLPTGMRLRHATDADLEARAELHRDAWSVWGPSSFSVEAYRKIRASAIYNAELDVVLEDAAGRLASYCIAWADAATGVGTFEPVGVRPEATGRGFGKAVIHEGWRRLARLGMHTALVGTASVNENAMRLYAGCDFDVVGRSHFYVKSIQ